MVVSNTRLYMQGSIEIETYDEEEEEEVLAIYTKDFRHVYTLCPVAQSPKRKFHTRPLIA